MSPIELAIYKISFWDFEAPVGYFSPVLLWRSGCMCLAGMSSAWGAIGGIMVSSLLDEVKVMVAVLGVGSQ
jgi:hypothetical protein